MGKNIFLKAINSEKLISFDIDSYQYHETNLQDENLSHGYCDFYTLKDKSQKLVFIANINQGLYFFCDNLYNISDSSLQAELKYGIFSRHFTLKKFDKIILDITYQSVDIDSDIFLDFVDLLKINPNTKKLKMIERSIRFYNEHDKQKRYLIGMESID